LFVKRTGRVGRGGGNAASFVGASYTTSAGALHADAEWSLLLLVAHNICRH
jgi:hypothetical protein